MAGPNQLFLLADHIKLSLLERQRAQSLLNATAGAAGAADTHDGRISRSLDQFRTGLEGLENEAERLREAGDEGCVWPFLSAAVFIAYLLVCHSQADGDVIHLRLFISLRTVPPNGSLTRSPHSSASSRI